MNATRNSALAVSALLLLAGCSSSGPAMFEWQSGKTLVYQVGQTQSQSIEIPGQGTQNNDSSTDMTISVSSKGPRIFEAAITDVSATGASQAVKGLVGLVATLTLDPNGTIVDASGLSDNATVKTLGGELSFRENFQGLFLTLPAEKLKPGVEWERTLNIPFEQQGLKMTRKGTDSYRVVQATDLDGVPVFEVSVASNVSVAGSGSQGGSPMDLTMGGKITGTLFVDSVSGSVLKAESSGDMIGSIDMPAASLPMSIHVTSYAKLVSE